MKFFKTREKEKKNKNKNKNKNENVNECNTKKDRRGSQSVGEIFELYLSEI